MSNIKFSIIVPVYNVEQYIERCLNSILVQTYDNFEIILVNDGSIDNTSKICNEYEKINKKIKVINKINGGLSDARNFGLKNITGDYVIFIDGDDYIDKNALNCFKNKLALKPDILITRLTEVYDDGNIKNMDDDMVENISVNPSKQEVVEWIFNKSKNTWPAPKYIVCKEIIEKFNLSFKKGYLHEDIDWTTNIFYYAESFSVENSPWYFHRIGRKDSITTTKNYKRCIDIINIVSEHINNPKFEKVNLNERQIIFNRLAVSTFVSLNQYKFADKMQRKKIEECLKENKEILKYGNAFRYRIFVLVSKIIGIKNSLILLKVVSWKNN